MRQVAILGIEMWQVTCVSVCCMCVCVCVCVCVCGGLDCLLMIINLGSCSRQTYQKLEPKLFNFWKSIVYELEHLDLVFMLLLSWSFHLCPVVGEKTTFIKNKPLLSSDA